MKNFVQKMTYTNGTVKEIRRDYVEMLDIHKRLESGLITGVKNFVRKSTFDCSFDRNGIHYELYLDESTLGVVGIHA